MEKGVRRTFWVSRELDILIEDIRRKLGMTKSTFYRYAVLRLLEEMSILSTKAKEGMIQADKVQRNAPELYKQLFREEMKHE